MAKLQIFVDKTPIYSKSTITLKAGFFADDYSLTDVTANCSFTVNFGSDTVTQTQTNQFFVNAPGDVGFKALYTVPNLQDTADLDTQYIATTSFVIIADAALPNKDDLYACIKREEPEGVYNQAADIESFTYLDNQAVADIFATLYQNLQVEANQVYPELTTDYSDWINTLFSEVYINTEQGEINKVFQFLRNLQILTSTNPFDIAWAITSYIYYRTNLTIYVFIQENKVNFDKAWILGTDQSVLGVNTYLQQSQTQSNLVINVFDMEQQLNDQFKIELENFVSKITRAYFGYTVDYVDLLTAINRR
ncbi:MAG: hypothetical protein QG673_1006 [Pseudomonadota bacterium]|nr:hypothetical protein [Pseudomonadota bacterium]